MCKDLLRVEFEDSHSRLEPELGDNFSCPSLKEEAATLSGTDGNTRLPLWEASSSLKEGPSDTPGEPSCTQSHEFGACSSEKACASTPANTKSVNVLFGAMNVGGGAGGDGSDDVSRGIKGSAAGNQQQGREKDSAGATNRAGDEICSIFGSRPGEAAAQFSLADVIGKANLKNLLENPLDAKKREAALGMGVMTPEGAEMVGGMSGVLSAGQMSWENILFEEEHRATHADLGPHQHHLFLQHQQLQQQQEQVPRRMSWEQVEAFETKAVAATASLPAQSGTAPQKEEIKRIPPKGQKEEQIDSHEGDPEVHHEPGESAAGTVFHEDPRKKGGNSKAIIVVQKQPEPAGSAGLPRLPAAPASSTRSASLKRKSPGCAPGGDEQTSERGAASRQASVPAKGDKHSKVETARGWRDRRVRLSAHAAVAFYDVQDRLGLSNASQALEWLLEQAAPSIARLPKSSFQGAAGVAVTPATSLSAAQGEAGGPAAGVSAGTGSLPLGGPYGSSLQPGGVVGIPAGSHMLSLPGGHPPTTLGREATHLSAFMSAGGPAHPFVQPYAAAPAPGAAAASTESSSPGFLRQAGMGMAPERHSSLRSGLGGAGVEGHFREGGEAAASRYLMPGGVGARSSTPISGLGGPEYYYGLHGRPEAGRPRRLRTLGEPGDLDVSIWEDEGGALGASGRESSTHAASEGDASWLVGDTDWKGMEGAAAMEHGVVLPWESKPAGSEVGGARLSGLAEGAVTDASLPAPGAATPVPAASSSQCGQASESRRGGNQTAHSGRRGPAGRVGALAVEEGGVGGDGGAGEVGRRGTWSAGSRLGNAPRTSSLAADWLEEGADDPAAHVGDDPDLHPGFWYGRSGSEIALRYLSEGGGTPRVETVGEGLRDAAAPEGVDRAIVSTEPAGSGGAGGGIGGGGSGKETGGSSRSRRGEQHAAAAAASAAVAAQAAVAAAAAVSAGSHHPAHHPHWRHHSHPQAVPHWPHGYPPPPPGMHDPYYHHYGPGVVPGLYAGYPAEMRPGGMHRAWPPGPVYPGYGGRGAPYYLAPAYADPYAAQRYAGHPGAPRFRERSVGLGERRERQGTPGSQLPSMPPPDSGKDGDPS